MTSIKVEDTLGEIRYAGGINSALPVSLTATATLSIPVLTSPSLLGTVTATGSVIVASNSLLFGTATGPTILYGSVTGGAAPTTTAPLGSIFINAAGTGPASRLFVNATGATLWVPVTTSA